MIRRGGRAALALLAVVGLATCHDAPTGPRKVEPRHELVFVPEAPAGDESVQFAALAGGTDSTIRLALRVPRAIPLTALAWELELVGSGAILERIVAGDLFVGDPEPIVEAIAEDGGRRWLGVVSLDAYDREVVGPGTIVIADVRRRSDQPFTVVVRFVAGSTTLYGSGGEPTSEVMRGGQLVYRQIGTTAAR